MGCIPVTRVLSPAADPVDSGECPERRHPVVGGEIGDEARSVSSGGGDLVDDGIGLARLEAVDDHPCTLGREHSGDTGAGAAVAAGDDCGSACESEIHDPSLAQRRRQANQRGSSIRP